MVAAEGSSRFEARAGIEFLSLFPSNRITLGFFVNIVASVSLRAAAHLSHRNLGFSVFAIGARAHSADVTIVGRC